MNQNRNPDTDVPTPSSNMEPAEGSRETESGNDLGSSTDRAMFDERMRSGDGSTSSDREGEMTSNSDGDDSNAGGITNRPLDREQSEQEQLPPRGHSKLEH